MFFPSFKRFHSIRNAMRNTLFVVVVVIVVVPFLRIRFVKFFRRDAHLLQLLAAEYLGKWFYRL